MSGANHNHNHSSENVYYLLERQAGSTSHSPFVTMEARDVDTPTPLRSYSTRNGNRAMNTRLDGTFDITSFRSNKLGSSHSKSQKGTHAQPHRSSVSACSMTASPDYVLRFDMQQDPRASYDHGERVYSAEDIWSGLGSEIKQGYAMSQEYPTHHYLSHSVDWTNAPWVNSVNMQPMDQGPYARDDPMIYNVRPSFKSSPKHLGWDAVSYAGHSVTSSNLSFNQHRYSPSAWADTTPQKARPVYETESCRGWTPMSHQRSDRDVSPILTKSEYSATWGWKRTPSSSYREHVAQSARGWDDASLTSTRERRDFGIVDKSSSGHEKKQHEGSQTSFLLSDIRQEAMEEIAAQQVKIEALQGEIEYLHHRLGWQQATSEDYKGMAAHAKAPPSSERRDVFDDAAGSTNDLDFVRHCVSNNSTSAHDRHKALEILNALQIRDKALAFISFRNSHTPSNDRVLDPAMTRVEMQVAEISRDLIKVKIHQKLQRMQKDSDRLAHIEAKISSPTTSHGTNRTNSLIEKLSRDMNKLDAQVSKLKEFSRDGTPRTDIQGQVRALSDQIEELRQITDNQADVQAQNVEDMNASFGTVVSSLEQCLGELHLIKNQSKDSRQEKAKANMDKPADMPWAAWEDATLKAMRADNKTWKEMTAVLGRPKHVLLARWKSIKDMGTTGPILERGPLTPSAGDLISDHAGAEWIPRSSKTRLSW